MGAGRIAAKLDAQHSRDENRQHPFVGLFDELNHCRRGFPATVIATKYREFLDRHSACLSNDQYCHRKYRQAGHSRTL